MLLALLLRLFKLVLQFGIIQGVTDNCDDECISMLQTHTQHDSIKRKVSFATHSGTVSASIDPGTPLTEQEIPLVTVNTFDDRRHFPVPGVPGRHFINLGAGKSWGGYTTKINLIQEWLEDVMLPRDPDGIAVLVDSGDVLNGGCTEDELRSRYKSISSASGGASVVFGAELGIWPASLKEPGRYKNFDSRRKAVQQLLLLSDESYGQYANVTLCQERMHISPCSLPPAYQFLNAGFIMGPAKTLHKVYTGMLQLSVSRIGAELNMSIPDGGWDDQAAAAEYMFSHENDVTLDYTGSLSIELPMFHDPMKYGLLFTKNGKWHNNVTGLVQCFVHGNGPNEEFFPQMLAQLG